MAVLKPDQYNIVELIDQHTPLEREGSHYWRSKEYSSLVVDERRNCYFYNSDGSSGDIYNFLTDIMGFSFSQAMSIVERSRKSLPTLRQQKQEENREYIKLPYSLAQEHNQSLDQTGYEWWEDRGVHPKIVDRLLLGFWRDDYGTPWYTIPIPGYPDRKYLANYKLRRGCPSKHDQRYRQWTGRLEATVYVPFPELIEGSEKVVLVAGEIKAIVLGQYGLPVITSSTGVATWHKHWDIVADKEVVICFDPKEHLPQNGSPQSVAEQITQKVLDTGARHVREVVLPHDPDDCIVKHGWHPNDIREKLGMH